MISNKAATSRQVYSSVKTQTVIDGNNILQHISHFNYLDYEISYRKNKYIEKQLNST